MKGFFQNLFLKLGAALLGAALLFSENGFGRGFSDELSYRLDCESLSEIPRAFEREKWRAYSGSSSCRNKNHVSRIDLPNWPLEHSGAEVTFRSSRNPQSFSVYLHTNSGQKRPDRIESRLTRQDFDGKWWEVTLTWNAFSEGDLFLEGISFDFNGRVEIDDLLVRVIPSARSRSYIRVLGIQSLDIEINLDSILSQKTYKHRTRFRGRLFGGEGFSAGLVPLTPDSGFTWRCKSVTVTGTGFGPSGRLEGRCLTRSNEGLTKPLYRIEQVGGIFGFWREIVVEMEFDLIPPEDLESRAYREAHRVAVIRD